MMCHITSILDANCKCVVITAPRISSLGLVSTENVSLKNIICHRNFGNEFAFIHCIDYLYYLARKPMSQIFEIKTLPQN